MTPDRLRPFSAETHRLIETNKKLAGLELSVDHPADLTEALETIHSKLLEINGGKETPYETLGGIAYFLGEEMAGLQWRNNHHRVAISPFVGLERLKVNYSAKRNVVLVGCWGGQLLAVEELFLAGVGITNATRSVVDISTLPVERLKILRPDVNLIRADATSCDVENLKPDLILTDLLMDTPDTKTAGLLANLVNSLSDDGHLLTRFCLIPDKVKNNYFRLLDMAGEFWCDTARRIFGYDSETDRDNYYGLTPEQWRELGLLFGSFIKTNFYKSNRFKSQAEVMEFLAGNKISILDKISLSEVIGRPGEEITILALAIGRLKD